MTAEAESDPSASVPPIRVSAVIQMDPLWRPGRTDAGYGGDLPRFAEDMTRYLVKNLERFTDQRGADLFVAVSAQRGDATAAHEYRSGHYVKSAEPTDEPAVPPDVEGRA